MVLYLIRKKNNKKTKSQKQKQDEHDLYMR